MEIVPARLSDIDAIVPIYDQARSFMRKTGNLTQWGDGDRPGRESAEKDIADGVLYVVWEAGEIVGVFVYMQGENPEPFYSDLDGEWLADGPYGVMHRVASSGKARGVVAACCDWALARCPSLRIDTHNDNWPMRQALDRYGFQYCGKIYYPSCGERLAYQILRR